MAKLLQTNVVFPDSLRFTPAQEKELKEIRTAARMRHEKERKRAHRQGRHFPDFPYECSWAFEQEYRRRCK